MLRPLRLFSVMVVLFLTATAIPMPPKVMAQGSADPAAILAAVKAKYDAIHDYRVNIRAVVKMTGVSVPPMDATMYYKKPDRIQIESDGFAMLPRDAVAFHPAMFDADEYDMVVQGREKVQGVECTKVKLLARSDTTRLQRAMLFIDTQRALIMRMEFDPGAGAKATAAFSYTQVESKYWLPSRIDVEMESPRQFRRPGQTAPKEGAKQEKARISMTYGKYVVNKGIDDAVFEKPATASPWRNRK